MSLQERVQKDFTDALLCKDTKKKMALSLVKAAFINELKKDGSETLSDEKSLDVLVKMVKQRKDSITEFTKGGREDLVVKEQEELDVISEYLPKQMDTNEIEVAIRQMLGDTDLETLKTAQGKGKLRGAFTKQYKGQFDTNDLVTVLDKLSQ